MKKIKWFAKGALVSTWMILAWILGDPLLGHGIVTAYLVAAVALVWLVFAVVEKTDMKFGLMVAAVMVVIGFSVSPVAVVVIASIAYGLDRNDWFPSESGRTTVRTLFISVPSVIIFASTIHMWGWKIALIATGVMLALQLLLLYLPVQGEETKTA